MRLLACLLICLAGLPARGDDSLGVELVTLKETTLTFDAELTGTIYASDTVDVGFRQGGKVTEVLVREGDQVRLNQPLAITDPLQQQQSLRVAEASVSAAQAAMDQAEQAHDRAVAMMQRGVGTRADTDRAAQDLATAARVLAQAHSAHEQAHRAVEDTVLRAPADAIVTRRMAEPGQIVGAAQVVLCLASSDGREAVFQIPDGPLLRDAIGALVNLWVIDAPQLYMTARVTEIAPLVDPSTGSVTVRARIDQPPTDADLLGAAVRGAVHFPAGPGIAVPWTALTSFEGGPAVWGVDETGHVSLLPVQIQRFTEGTVILSGGVTPGQTVVGAGSQLLYPGRKIVGLRP
ncbi:MAG: efflux RND transporter periplasmic adaptor subunit [Paracoccus sp. (in: a-proteobacteria)]|uniref:efflux RND transporter periplasmic adaptor subunit n=1 Tax=Paracoccus sp. TaxID=267 RepID=UPI0039E6C0D7